MTSPKNTNTLQPAEYSLLDQFFPYLLVQEVYVNIRQETQKL